MSVTALNTALGRIKEKLPLSKIVGIDVVLHKKGKECVGNCPFHSEKTGSFFVNDDKGTFYCFGCGASGDIVEYTMRKNGIQFMQAVEKLAELASIKLPEKNKFENDNHLDQQKILQKAVEYYKKSLSKNQFSLEYCQKRCINSENIENFSIGYSPISGDELLSSLKNSGFSDEMIVSSGLFIKKDNNKLIPRFRDRIMFPVFDKRGWPIAFGGRGIQNDSIPKYLNSPETDIFQKRETLYGYNIATKNVNANKQFIIVEGYIDVVMMHKFGFNTTIASMGTSFSSEHLAKIWKYSNEPIICFDGDNAGYNAMFKTGVSSLPYLQPGKSLRFCLIPEEIDPDSFLREKGKSEFTKLIDNSVYLIDFLWNSFTEDFNKNRIKTPEKMALWKKEIFDIIEKIQNMDIKRLYKSEINNRIFKFLNNAKNNNSKYNILEEISFSVDKKEKILLREAILLYTIIMRPSIISFVVDSLSIAEFSNKDFENLRDDIMKDLSDFELENRPKTKTVEYIISLCSKNFNIIDEMSDVEISNFWHSVFEFGFSRKAQNDDLILAKNECNNELSVSNWERLKAIKIDSFFKKKNGI